MNKTRKTSVKASPAQMRQRELSWGLYIVSGATANIEHLLAVNAYTLEPADLTAMRRAVNELVKAEAHLRRAMNQIK